MCSISTNRTVDEQLTELERSNDRSLIEKRLYHLANEANRQQPGLLDALDTRMKRMPDDLKNIRKKQIGRHRIYFTGHHRQCSYATIYIKKHKKSGVDDEDDRRFQNKLRRALDDPSIRNLE